jgi:hypothetical protein
MHARTFRDVDRMQREREENAERGGREREENAERERGGREREERYGERREESLGRVDREEREGRTVGEGQSLREYYMRRHYDCVYDGACVRASEQVHGK